MFFLRHSFSCGWHHDSYSSVKITSTVSDLLRVSLDVSSFPVLHSFVVAFERLDDDLQSARNNRYPLALV